MFKKAATLLAPASRMSHAQVKPLLMSVSPTRGSCITSLFKASSMSCRNNFPYVGFYFYFIVVAVQSLSSVWLFVTPWIIARQAPLPSTISWSLLKFMSIESVMLSNHLILCFPVLLLPSNFPSIRVFPNESALCIRRPNIGALVSASVLPMNEYSGLTSFRFDRFISLLS